MICPKCGAEYVAGFTTCSDCLVPLVDSLPEPEPKHKSDSKPERDKPTQLVDPVCVFRSSHPGHVSIAESILQSASVPFVVLNKQMQNPFGLGSFPGGYNIALGPVEIMVSRSEAEDARTMVRGLEGDEAGTSESLPR